MSRALNNIDKNSKGNSKLFEYLDTVTEFEDLLYGLEPYYRDHILHSLWVYILGEHILRDLIPDIHDKLNWYLYNEIELNKSSYPKKLLDEAIEKEEYLYEKVNMHKDAIWCIIALCHDLGYSISKIDRLNEKVKRVLHYFDLPQFQHIGYSLELEHQYNISQFLELMAMEIWIVPSEDLKEPLVKSYRDDSAYWRLCRGLEKKQHGILGAYIIYKTLDFFAAATVRGPSEQWGLDDEEAKDNIIRGDILFAITQHAFDFAHLTQFSSLADVLVLADELEEFSRYGRQMLSRKYHDTTAETIVSFKRHDLDIEISIKYEVARHLKKEDIDRFYVRKAEQICKFYSLNNDEKKSNKFFSISRIEMAIKKFTFCLTRDSFKALLPIYKKYKSKYYNLICEDDKLYVNVEPKRILLEEWLKIDK